MTRSRRSRRVLARGLCMTTWHEGDLVVRRPRRWCRFFLGPSLARGMTSTLRLFRRYLPIPATRTIRGRFGDFVVVQRHVAGAVPLRDVPDARLREPAVAAGLRALLASVERCYAETGWLPDVGGRVYVPGELYDVRRSDNLVLGADGRWWLVDVGATALFHSRRWPTGRLHTRLMLRTLRRFAGELGRDSARRGARVGPRRPAVNGRAIQRKPPEGGWDHASWSTVVISQAPGEGCAKGLDSCDRSQPASAGFRPLARPFTAGRLPRGDVDGQSAVRPSGTLGASPGAHASR